MNGILQDFFPDFFSIDEGNYDDMVISSRVSLTRNLQNHLFTTNLTEKGCDEVIFQIRQALEQVYDLVPEIADCYNSNLNEGRASDSGKERLVFKTLRDVSPHEANLLAERDILPQTALRGPKTAIAYTIDKTLFAMINFIDHLRLIGFASGFDIINPFEQTKNLATRLQQSLDFATDERFGYLSSQLSELGSGLNFQIILHLPSILKSGMSKEIFEETEAKNFKILPFSANTYAPNLLDGHSGFFVLTNRTSFYGGELRQVGMIKEAAERLLSMEVATTDQLKSRRLSEVKFDVQKAISDVGEGKFLTAQNAMSILSILKLGVKTEILRGISQTQLNRIFYRMGPGNLQFAISNEKVAFPEDIKTDVQKVNYLRSLIFKECLSKTVSF